RATVGDHIVDSYVLRNMLAHIINHKVHRFYAIEGGTATIGSNRRVGGLAMKTKLCPGVRQIAILGGILCIAAMPIQRHVHVVEKSGANHVDLAASAFFCRCAIDADL